MKRSTGLFSLLLIIMLQSVLMIGCEDEGNDLASIKGVLLDIDHPKPMPGVWVVLKTGSGTNGYGETEFDDLLIDSCLTDLLGRFKFNNINPNHTVYNLTPHKKDYILADPIINPPFASLITSKSIFDTLQMGIKASINIKITHENINDGKSASPEISFRTTALGIDRKEYAVFVDNSIPHEIRRDYLYKFNNTININFYVYDDVGGHHITYSNIFNLMPKGTQSIEFKY